MGNKKILVVGSKFKEISNMESILSYEQLIQKTLSNQLIQSDIFFEQGVCEEMLTNYKDLLAKYKHRKSITICSYFERNTRCEKKFTHKKLDFNTLISDPEKIDEKKYSSVLMIDERCAEISDHVTGKHIQLMVLIEAARQMVMAVTEKFFIPADMRNQLSFVSENTETHCDRFALPFFTILFYEIECQKILPGNNIM